MTRNRGVIDKHLLSDWRDAAPELRSIQWGDLVRTTRYAPATARQRHSRRPDGPVSSHCKRRNRTSTPESPMPECGSVPLARNVELLRRRVAPRLERKRAAHTTGANGTLLLECRSYGCLVPHLYNCERPHSSLDYRTPQEFKLALEGRRAMARPPSPTTTTNPTETSVMNG